jgi:hypothetical protein
MQDFHYDKKPRWMRPNYAKVIVVAAVELERQLASVRNASQPGCGALELDC